MAKWMQPLDVIGWWYTHSQRTALATRHTATATSHHVSDSFWRAELKIPRDCDDVMAVVDLATAIFVAQLQIVEE